MIEASLLRDGLRIAWWLASAVLVAVALVPWFASPADLAATVPRCRSQVEHLRPCALCGLTTSFDHMAAGRPLAAGLHHGLGPFAYFACACNGVAAAGDAVRALRRPRVPRS